MQEKVKANGDPSALERNRARIRNVFMTCAAATNDTTAPTRHGHWNSSALPPFAALTRCVPI